MIDWLPWPSIPGMSWLPYGVLIYEDCGCFFLSSLAHQTLPEQSARRLIYGRRFDINRPMDLNAQLFCAWMMSEGHSCQSSTSWFHVCMFVLVSWKWKNVFICYSCMCCIGIMEMEKRIDIMSAFLYRYPRNGKMFLFVIPVYVVFVFWQWKNELISSTFLY